MSLFLLIGLLALIYLIVVLLVNRVRVPSSLLVQLAKTERPPACLPTSISVCTWNIGYAGLGRESEFYADGGRAFFPPSREAVIGNLTAIEQQISSRPVDVHLIQEASQSGPMNLWHPVLKTLVSQNPNQSALFRPDISTWGLSWPLSVRHGTLTLSKANAMSSECVDLPIDPDPLLGLIQRRYALAVTRFLLPSGDAQWVIVNLHLAAFDKDGAARQRQLLAAFEFGQREYEKGNFVVLGGDWNLELTSSNFPHSTPDEHLFWRVPFPTDHFPAGFQLVFDRKLPTVRTLNRPYMKGENYTSIIDGFVVSPNVRVDDVSTHDTDFKHTDHMPVYARFSALD